MNDVDFSSDLVMVRLVNPIFYTHPKTRVNHVIDVVEISRMNTPQLNSFKTKINQIAAKLGSLSFMVPFFHLLCRSAVVRFYEDGLPVQVHDRDQVVDLLPFESSYKVALFILMHLRETGYVTGSYKCGKCLKTNIFDIDPSLDIPGDIEIGRGYQFNYLDFCIETYNIEKEQFFTYRLSKPVVIEIPEQTGDKEIKWVSAEVDFFKFSYPTIKTYSEIAQNPDRALSSDYYALYESIVEIADFDRQNTQKIKLKNTINKIFNFKNKEFNQILSTYQKYLFDNRFSYSCLHCGHENETVFDMTNFFESLKS